MVPPAELNPAVGDDPPRAANSQFYAEREVEDPFLRLRVKADHAASLSLKELNPFAHNLLKQT